MTIMGGCREIIGSGTLFLRCLAAVSPHFKFMELHVLPGYHGFLLMLLLPGTVSNHDGSVAVRYLHQ